MITGDRQSGKTQALIDLAASEFDRGYDFLYICPTFEGARKALDALVLSARSECLEVSWVAGDLRVEDTDFGARAFFATYATTGRRAVHVDALFLDDLDPSDETVLVNAVAASRAARVYRAPLSDDLGRGV